MKVEEITGMSDKEAYNLFKLANSEGEKLYNQVRFGIKTKFDYCDYINGIIKELPNGTVKYRDENGDVQKLSSRDFHTELESRRRLIDRDAVNRYGQDEVIREG